MSEIFSISGKNIHQAARASVISALYEVAAMKNVPLNPALCDELAGRVLDRMDFPSIHQVSSHEEDGLIAMVQEIDTHLDATAMVRLRHLIAAVERKDSLDDPAVEAATQAIVAKFVATLPKRGCPRWPDLVDMVGDYYTTVPRGPVTKEEPDGTVITAYWLGPDPHRDPKEGPAVHWARGEKHGCEYWVKGELHRDHRDGPAIIYTRYKNFDLSGEEYFENGKRHRPAELGPAVTHWDRNGEPVMKLFYENGEHHRDPKQGPAWFEIRNATTMKAAPDNATILKYAVRGQLHRNEEDGPAYIMRDEATGVALIERYWRNGVIHRDHGPAEIERKPDGTVFREAWVRNGEWHRAPGEGPASVVRQGNGIDFFEWHVMGKPHRDPREGPALIRHDRIKGTVQEEFWVEGGYRAAADGPASVTRDRDGNVIEELFWNGERLCPQYPETLSAEAGLHG